MGFKADRKLKVYEGTSVRQGPVRYGSHYKTQPQIRLQGDWLAELGFNPGTAMNVHCEKGKLVITTLEENEAVG